MYSGPIFHQDADRTQIHLAPESLLHQVLQIIHGPLQVVSNIYLLISLFPYVLEMLDKQHYLISDITTSENDQA